MKRWFKCPDGEKTVIGPCINGECRMGQRCAPLAYLRAVGDSREWSGKPSITQLTGGIREAYLTLRNPYVVDPNDSAFAVVGTNAHARMEKATPEGEAEQRMEAFGIVGRMDVIEKEPDGTMTIVDYKTHGSFAVAKVLGLEREEGEFDSDRPKKKAIPVWKANPEKADWGTTAMQLNGYRILYEEQYKPNRINALKVFIIVRDGGLQVATSRGITRNIYYVDVPMIAMATVQEYFFTRRDLLLKALESGKVPRVCSDTECWNGAKCLKYCNVAQWCAEFKDNAHLKTKGRELDGF
jgi:hypothetical protein